MKIYNVDQGSYDWIRLRLGIPTASAFDNIITPERMQLSKSAGKYARSLIAEQILGAPMDDFLSSGMMRGNSMEAEAVGWFELAHDLDTQPGGFGIRDDKKAGASADRLVGDNGLLEIKCPSAEQHIAYLVDTKGIGYRCQVQGQLWVYEREFNHTLSYHPGMPKAEVRQYRDEEFIGKLAAAINVFHEILYEMKLALVKAGHFDEDDLGIGAFPPLEVMQGGAA